MYFERAICFSTHQEDLSRNTTSVWLVHFDPKLQLRVYFCFFGLVHLDPTSQPSFVNCCFSFSLPVSRFWQRPESSLCTCLSGPRCKINAFKSKKLPVRWKSSELKDNFVVNMISAGRWAEAVDFLPVKKQLRLSCHLPFFLCKFSFEFSSSLKCFSWDISTVFKISYIYSLNNLIE